MSHLAAAAISQPSLSLQAAGVLALLGSLGHWKMGKDELAPGTARVGLGGNTLLKGWYQGCFMYAAFGLNYLRLASVPVLAPLDWAILGVQGLMHAFTLTGLEQAGPRALSAVLLGLVGTGALVKRQ